MQLAEPENPIFNIWWQQEKDQNKWEVFNLTSTFAISSSNTNILPTDCPIDYFVICNSSVAVCNRTTNLTSNETFIIN